jgi:hypothetical protein
MTPSVNRVGLKTCRLFEEEEKVENKRRELKEKGGGLLLRFKVVL